MNATRTKTLATSMSLLAALALGLTGCSTPEASTETTEASSAVATTPTTAAAAGNAVALEVQKTYDGKVIAQTPENEQLRKQASAQEYIIALTTSRYVMSGQWVEDGMKPADLAILYKNFLTPAFIDKLNAATKVEEITPQPVLMVLGLGTETQEGGVKASSVCQEDGGPSCVVLAPSEHEGKTYLMPAGTGIDYASVEHLPEGHLKFTYNGFIPVATFEGVDSAMEAILTADLVMVANPAADDQGQLPFLVDQVNITQTNAGITPLSESLVVR